MNAFALLERYFPDTYTFGLILEHSKLVAAKALKIADNLEGIQLDKQFIEEASLLHDIGVCRTAFRNTNGNCFEPYIRHGIIGREILEEEGLPRHALVCERHIGVGLSSDDVIAQGLPLPARDMVPLSMEEKIVSFADLFYSKNPGKIRDEKSIGEIKSGLAKFGGNKVIIFEGLLKELGILSTDGKELLISPFIKG